MANQYAPPNSDELAKTASDPLALIVQASATLLESPELTSVLDRILAVARRLVSADAYAVWRSYDGETWRILAADGLSPEYRADIIQNARGQRMTLEPIVVPDVGSAALLGMRTAGYAREGIRSLLVIPLVIKGEPAGTICFYFRHRHEFDKKDLQYASALANLAASALAMAEVYEAQVLQKKRSEFLAEASTMLGSSLDYELTLRKVADLAVPHIADWCAVHLFERGTLQRVAVSAADPEKLPLAEELSRRYPETLRDDQGTGRILRTGQSELYRTVPDELLVAAAQDEDHLRMIRALGMVSAIAVPLVARNRTVGVLRLISAESGRHFDENDLKLAEDLARRAAVAIDNARLHAALQTSEARLRSAFESAAAGFVLLTPDGRFLQANQAYCRITGYTEQELREMNFIDLTHADDALRNRDLHEQLLAGKVPNFTIEKRYVRKDGSTVWVRVGSALVYDENDNPTELFALVQDITEQKLAEETLRKSEKLAAAGRLAATIAHEINNPLEAATNLVFLAASDPNLQVETRQFLAQADQELGRVAHIARQTLGFYRDDSGWQRCDVNALVTSVVELYSRKLNSRSVRLRLELAEDAAADVVPGEMRQVIANLLSNAIDACGQEGEIRVRTRTVRDYLHLVISDTGHGIAQGTRGRVFEPFFTTKKDVGTGLGLFVTRQIVEKHGGNITVASSTDPKRHGTIFAVAVRRKRNATAARPEAA